VLTCGGKSRGRTGLGLGRVSVNWSLLNRTILMTPNHENAICMQRIEDSSLRQVRRLTQARIKVRNGEVTPNEKMSKMKVDPTMCMKTKARVTQCQTIVPTYWPNIH